MHSSCKSSGFTLIEVAIVLVIVAAIAGGILVAQSMIRESQMRNVVGEMQRHVQAIVTFRDKYGALPGDLSKAPEDEEPVGFALVQTDPCDSGYGNGDGRIGNNKTAALAAANSCEEFRAWEHLVNAGLVTATVTGMTEGATVNERANQYHYRIPGSNVPPSTLHGGGWGVTSLLPGDVSLGVDLPYFTGDVPPGHVLWLGGKTPSPFTSNRQQPLLRAQEALAIDVKLDDGYPNLGKVVAQINASAPLCATAATASGAYNVANATPICAPVFKTGF